MNVTCGSVIINTDGNHEVHKKSVQSIAGVSMLCDRSEPHQFFTQLINGYVRFYILHYNKSGEKLRKIVYWDRKKDSERKKKWIKVPVNDDGCYFSKNKKDQEFKLKEELDFWDIAHPHVTIWKRHWWTF